jgi:O-antigen ligase
VEGWAYVTSRIFERPLFGHGFDAVRTFDATQEIRGYDMSLVSLHPHNAGLHIWVETGVVGVGLAVFALILLAREMLAWVGDSRARAIATAGFVIAATVISSVSYGVWQEWWWASLFLGAALTPVLLREA